MSTQSPYSVDSITTIGVSHDGTSGDLPVWTDDVCSQHESPCSVGSITTTDASLDERCTQMRVLRTGFVASTAVHERRTTGHGSLAATIY